MKYDKELNTIVDLIGDNHLSTSEETPLREDAFDLSDTEKIEIIEKRVADILYTL
jgi:GTP cyclohydrolase I